MAEEAATWHDASDQRVVRGTSSLATRAMEGISQCTLLAHASGTSAGELHVDEECRRSERESEIQAGVHRAAELCRGIQ